LTRVPPADTRSERYAWYVVAILMLANVSFWIDRQILSLLVMPIQRDLGITRTQMSYLSAIPFAVFSTLLAVPIARLADSGRRRNVLAGGAALWSVMTALCGLAGTYPRLLLARIGTGVGESSLQPSAVSLISDYFRRERASTAMSVYSTAIFLGSGLAYFIGGAIVGLVSVQEQWRLPVIGAIHPWQTVFIAVGLPGILIALLMLTIREPIRTSDRAPNVSVRELLTYVRSHARTFSCVALGFGLSATVNLGIAFWLATFLIERHGWTAARAGMVQGSLTMAVGTLGVVAGGWVADRFVRAGRVDGPLRVGIIGAAGMLVSATAYPFAQSASMAVTWLVVVNFFAAFPWGAASTAAAEAVPAHMRAQGTSLYFLIVNLLSIGLGPVAVAVVADRVFGNAAAIASSLAVVNVVGMTGAIIFLLMGMPAYRKTLASREH
jgi:MFS family permease